MTVEISKEDDAWTIIHNRPEARNVMDPDSSDALVEVFGEFNTSEGQRLGFFMDQLVFLLEQSVSGILRIFNDE